MQRLIYRFPCSVVSNHTTRAARAAIGAGRDLFGAVRGNSLPARHASGAIHG
jgi:hypothetical protein